MDKQNKLTRYRQKDYSQLVDFPVEIVGRNGEIRSYSFEDSVRLYQRRIVSAPSRYTDAEVVRAEIRHCRSRVRQLRMSFFERYAPSAIRGRCGDDLGGEEAAEIVALLARYTRSTDPAAAHALRSLGRAGHAQLLFVDLAGAGSRLLYVFRFDGAEGEAARSACQAFLGQLTANVAATEVEHLHAHRATADLALVLTGREPRTGDDGLADLPALFDPWEPQPGPLQVCAKLMRTGAARDALRILDGILAERPDDRNAALTASIASLQAGDAAQAELYARLALAYFPGDGVLLHQHGVVLVAQQRFAEAAEVLRRSAEATPALFQARLLAALLELHQGHARIAAGILDGDRRAAGRGHTTAARYVRSMTTRARLRVPVLVLCLTAVAVSGTWVLLGFPHAVPSFVGVAGCAAVLALSLRYPSPIRVAQELIRRVPVPREILPGQPREAPRPQVG